MGVGVNLKRVREKKGISVEQLHKATKLHYNIINALEEDRLDTINPIYARMFIRDYCKALGVDAKEFLDTFSASLRTKKDASAVPIKSSQQPVAVKVSFRKSIKPKYIYLIVGALVLFLLIYLIGYAISHKKKSGPGSTAVKAEKRLADKKAEAKVAREEPRVSVKTKIEKTPARESILLGVRAKKKTWLKVKADESIVFQGNIEKLRFESWKAKDKIEIWASNVNDLELELNGKLLSSLGRKGRAIRQILITAKGLSVIK